MADLGGTATAGIGGAKVRAGIDIKGIVALAIILGLLAYGGYMLASSQLADNADLTAPPQQDPDERDGGMATVLATLNPLDGSHRHTVVAGPEHHYNGYVFLPHRYPRTVGGNITNTIHHGFSSMRLPACDDISRWMATPPSEVPW